MNGNADAVGSRDLVLFVAAFAPELDPLVACLGPGLDGAVAGRRAMARAVGVGLPASAAGTAAALDRVQPRCVVALGTCGAYARSGLALHDVVVSAGVHLVDASILSGKAQHPPAMAMRVEADARLRGAFERLGARPAEVATTLAITVDDEHAAFMAERSGAAVEHLEAFAVATACAAARVPFVAVFGVANAVGAAAREQWRANHRRASERAVEHAVSWLRAGAEGAPAGAVRS